MSIVILVRYLMIGISFKRFVTQAPYFKQQYTKTPHITGNGVLFEVDRLKCMKILP